MTNTPTLVAVRIFETNSIIKTQDDKKNILTNIYKQGWKDSATHTIMPLSQIATLTTLALIVPTETHNLVIVDFDVQEDFDTAMLLNQALPLEEQCQYIVTSSRKGGHFYYLPTEGISSLHSVKGVKVDIQGVGHNVLAATPGDPSKTATIVSNQLTHIHPLMLHYINSLINSQATPSDKKVYLTSKEGYSDDNFMMVESYLVGRLPEADFHNYYNLPAEIPAGDSYPIILSLAMRLLCDETITHENVLAALDRYDSNHRQDHKALAPADINKFVADKQNYTLTLQHSDYGTAIATYFDRHTGDHIVQFSKEDGEPEVLIQPTESKVKILLEKMVRLKRSQIKWHHIRDVDVVSTYTEPGGFNLEEKQFNTSYLNTYLTAFKGTKPADYKSPDELLDLMKYMWQDEFDYLLSHTKWRYNTFEHSPVIHHIVGVEGSGKNLTENLLNRGFSEDSQELDYQLFMDKHSNHQILPNTVLGEVGDWNKIQQGEALSKIKTMSGCQGKTPVRGMQQQTKVVPTINKIWVLGNSWMKLHNNPLTQRRVHAVYMPRPLTTDFGGPYSPTELEQLLSHKIVVDFYYYLGSEYNSLFTKSEYQSAFSRQKSKSYQAYLETVEGISDRVIKLLAEQDWESLLRAIELVEKDVTQLNLKYNQQDLLVISLSSMKVLFGGVNGSADIFRALQDLNSQKEGGRVLKFDRSPEKYLTFYNAPYNLGDVKEEELKMTK